MRKIHFIAAFAAIVASAISCSKEIGQNTDSQAGPALEGTSLSISVGAESKTLLRPSSTDAGEVHWSSDDKIKVFDKNKKGFVFSTEDADKKEATFTCDNWTGNTPLLAVHSNKASSSSCTCSDVENGKVTAYINPAQTMFHKNSYSKNASASIGKVSKNEEKYSIQEMKNLFSLIKFKVENSNIVKITMKGRNSEQLSGWFDVDYNDGNPTWAKSGSLEAIDTIVMRATGNACATKNDGKFAKGTYYYIAALPQTLSEGFTLELEKENGAKATRTITSSIALNRNEIRALKHPVDSLLPFEPITFTIDKGETGTNSWPFEETCVAAANQKKTGTEGETYTYKYSDGGVEKTASFVIANPSDESTGYSWTQGSFLKFGNVGTGAWIKLPAIEGRKLYSVSLTINNTGTKEWMLSTTNSSSGKLYTYKGKAVSGSYVTGSYASCNLSENTSYYIYLSGGRLFQMTNLTVVYDK